MTDLTVNALVTKIERELSMVPGLNVQVYAKDNLAQRVQAIFDITFSEKNWKRFNRREQHTLDGVTGSIVDTFTQIPDFDNIVRIFPADRSVALAKLPLEFNPNLEAGGLPRYYEFNGTIGKLITVHPVSALGDIVVMGQYRPPDFLQTDVVPFDQWAIIYGAAWMYAVDDGANPAAIAKFQGLYEKRIKQLYSNQTDDPIRLTGNRSGEYPTTWSDNG